MAGFQALSCGDTMTKEQEEQGFTVTDRRGFREEGEPPAASGGEKAPPQAAEPAREEAPAGPKGEPGRTIEFPSY